MGLRLTPLGAWDGLGRREQFLVDRADLFRATSIDAGNIQVKLLHDPRVNDYGMIPGKARLATDRDRSTGP